MEKKMSNFAIKVKSYYERGMWDLSRVDKALELKKITEEEYNIIVTGKSPVL